MTDGVQSTGFNDDMIRRSGLPGDVMGLIHDLCYHHEGRDVSNYVMRAQEILKSSVTLPQFCAHLFIGRHSPACRRCGHIPSRTERHAT